MLHPYLELKLSWELFKKPPEALSAPERGRLSTVAKRHDSIERRILCSPEAARVAVPTASLEARLSEIRARYPSEGDYLADLHRVGLQESELAEAVTRDLRVEAILDTVTSAVPAVSEPDAEIYYHFHPDRFERPEARRLRHILVTHKSRRERKEARRLLDSLRRKVVAAEDFATAARRYSHCPTAVEGGTLGTVRRGQLYAELEPAAFALGVDKVSAVLASPVGLHILRCDATFEAGMMPFDAVKDRIIEMLANKRRALAQREWISRLP